MDSLLPLLACPLTGAPLRLLGSPEDGLLATEGGALYPIIQGIPRLLPPSLLAPFLARVYPEVLTRYPALAATLADVPPAEAVVVETLSAYDYQHVELADAALLKDDWRATWDRFQPDLSPESFAGQTVLEVGCGEGRHAALIEAALVVGLDLSRGVEVARRRDPRPNAFYVQADLRHPPFKPGVFDALYSNGVLHHTPDPRASFDAVVPLVRPGGVVSIWVYGLDEMRWSYRMSHLTWLRPLSGRLPRPAQVALAAGLLTGLELGLWLPVRTLERVGLKGLAARVPYAEGAHRDLRYKLRRVFDRLNPPVTHYLSREALLDWFKAFDQVEIQDTQGQGWSARGQVRG